MMPVVVKFFALGGMTWRKDTICPTSIIPASCSLGVEVYQNLIPELSTVPVASQCVFYNLVRPYPQGKQGVFFNDTRGNKA